MIITVKNVDHAPKAYVDEDQDVASGKVTPEDCKTFDPDNDVKLSCLWIQTRSLEVKSDGDYMAATSFNVSGGDMVALNSSKSYNLDNTSTSYS